MKKKKKSHPTLALWHSSSPSKKALVLQGKAKLKSLMIDFFEAKETSKFGTKPQSKRAFLAGSDLDKIKSLKKIADQKSIQDILVYRGGYGSLRLLDGLNAKVIRSLKRKRIWGFSDLTTLQNGLHLVSGSSWVHSPLLTSQSFFAPNSYEKKYWKSLLDDSNSDINFVLKTKKSLAPKFKQFSAKLIGGNLACLVALCGSKFFKLPAQPFFLFLEDIGEPEYRLDRFLAQLKNAGLFKNCRGILLGHFKGCPKFRNVFDEFASENSLPLLWGLPVGHDRPNVPLLMGVKISLVKKSNSEFMLRMPKFKFG